MAPPDLELIGQLCDLALRARRLHCSIRLVDPSPELEALIRLAGLGDTLLGEPADSAGHDGPPPESTSPDRNPPGGLTCPP